uniref:G-protein coupled receptors family 3 profile domain-containing protein n=1 Tax=Anopheles arabiensis TaxID=7173 RepID=A0A182HN15_ANOAR
MARRPKRSALVLAIALVAFCQLVHYRCVVATGGVAGAGVVPQAVSSGEEADAAADLDAAESNHRALLNLPKFGDRLAPRNRPQVEDIGPVGASERPSVSGRQARGPTVYAGGRVPSGGSGPPPAHHPPGVPSDNDIKRSDVMMMVVSSRSVKGAGVRAGSQDLTEEDEEEEGEEEEGEEEIEAEEVAKGGDDSGGDYFAIDAAHKPESLGRSSGTDQLAQNRLEPTGDGSAVVSGGDAVVQQQPESAGRSASAGINIAGISNASSAQAHRLEMSTEFFVVPSTASSAASRSTTVRPGGVILAARHPAAATSSSSSSSTTRQSVTPPTVVSTTGYAGGLRKEPWVVPVLVLASLSMLMMAAFEVFVLCKAWRTSPSRRHLFLGQMLLLGLFACSGLAAVLTVNPTVLSCATMRFGAGVAFALVFASLLVKCVFLISLNGGVYLPAPYQGLLLLFAVLIQVAVGGQWLLTSPPGVDNVPVGAGVGGAGSTAVSSRYHLLLTAGDLAATATPTIPLCHTPFAELLLSLIYIVFLIVFVAILAIKSRGIRDNYREATYIGLAIGGIIPIWLGWTLCGLAVADRHRDACLAFGLVATSSTVFLVMFMPKGRQLAAMGKEGLYVEDREERFSSLSRAGSGYSPSFFHFKPIKYGVMGPSPTLQTASGNLVGTTAATTTTKHHQAVATLGGVFLRV